MSATLTSHPRPMCVPRGTAGAAFSLTLTLALGVLALSPATVLAQSEGRVRQDNSIIWRADATVVAATVNTGTTLEITAQSARWYEVVIPTALGGRGERGLIARSQVELLPGAAEPPVRALRGDPIGGAGQPAGGPAGTSARAAAARRPAFPRGRLWVNGGYQSTSSSFVESATFRVNAEDGRFDTDYAVRGGPALGFGVAGMVSPRVGVGMDITWYTRTTPAALTGGVPHPFFFNAPRPVSGQVGDLQRNELGLHWPVRAAWPLGSRVEVTVLGGPSMFRVSQDIVEDFTYTDSYPYDQAAFQAARVVKVNKWRMGFNVGADAAVFFTRRMGVGFTATFARSTMDLPVTSSRSVEVEAGGLVTAAGWRLRF